MNNLLRDSYPNEDYIIIDSEDTIDFRDCIKSRYVVFCFAPHLDREEVTSFSILWERNLCLTRICFALFDLEHISIFLFFYKPFLYTGLVVVGFSGGSIQQIPANHLLVKNCSALGIYLGGYLKNRPEVVQKVILVHRL